MSEKSVKKAVVAVGGRQYLVSEGQEIEVNKLNADKSVSFEPLLFIDGDKIEIGTPLTTGHKVTAEILESIVKAPKVTAIRFKAKKRVRKVRGHRQLLTKIKISKIA